MGETMSTVSKLQIVLEATTTAFDNGLKKAVAGLQGFAKKTDEIHSKMDKFARKNKDALDGLQTAGAAAAVGLGVIAVGIKGAVTAAVDFEKSMAGVKKVVNFETPEQFKQMEQDIIALSQRLPMAATDIAAIMEAAGQSGIAREELSRFAESAIKMGVAFDITAEEAGKAMAEMRASFGMSQTEVETLADQINYLGNNSTNSAPQIMEVVQRIGSLAETANISSSTLAALSASMVGVAPEVAATSLKNFSLQLVKGESLSKSAKAAFETMGLDYNQVAQDMQKDSEATIRKVLEAAQKVPEHMRAAVLNDAFGSESIAAISQLVTNYETVDKNLKAMGDSATYAGSMLKEFEGQAGTSAAQMQVFDNNIQAMKIAFGTAFLPVLNQAMEALTPVIKSITEWAQKNPELVATITGIVAGVLGAIAVLGGLALAFTAVTSGIGAVIAIGSMIGGFFSAISAGVGIVSMFGGALAALGFPVTAVVAGFAALVAGGIALYTNWDTIKAKAIEVWNAIPEYASQAWQWIQGVWSGVGAWFGGIWDSVSASVSSAFDSVVSAITSAWSGVSTWFGGIWDGITASVSGAIDSVISTITGMASSISTAFANFSFESFVSGVIAEIEYAIMVALPAMWQNVTQSILSLFANAPAPVQEMVANILSIVGYAIDGLGLVFQGLLFVASTVWTGITTTVAVAVSVISAIWQTLTSVASTVWAGITAVAQTVFNAVVSVWQGLVSAVSSAWQGVVSVATSIWDAVKSAVASAINAIRVVIIGVTSFFASAWQGIVGVATSVWNSVKSAVQSAINAIKQVITSVSSFFASAWNGLVSVAQSVWNGVKAAVSAGINGAKAVLTAGVTGFAIIFNAGFNAVKTVVSTAFNVIKALVRGDINGVKTAIQSGLSQLGGIARNAMSQMVSAVMSIGGRLRQAGTEIVQGLINGISAKMEAAVAKIREMASRMKSAVTGFFDINSPSRVMKQIGEWVSEGMAIGVAYKAPVAVKEAKKMAEDTKKAVESEMESLARSIFITQQKIAGNPFAELTADIAFGKYQGQDTTQLLALKEEERKLASVLSLTDELRKLKQDTALVGKSNLEIMEWEYENTDKYLGITREVFDTYKNANIALANRQFAENDIKKVINERAGIGKNEIDLLRHKLDTEKEYLHISQALKDGLIEQTQLKLFETKQAEAQLELAKKLYMLKNASDPLAEKKWQLSQSGMSPEQQQALLDIENQGMIADKFGKLQEGLKAGTAFSLPTFSGSGLEGAGNALKAGLQGAKDLDTQLQEKLETIRQARQAELDLGADFDAQELALIEAHQAAKRELTIGTAEQIASGLSSAAKTMFGEQSKAYKLMFAVEKGVAIARSVMAIQQAIAFAAANPFPMNIGAMATVIAQTASIVSNIRAVKNPVVGQAHDGIMSVPKSGTWNLEKGERVLPEHTAKALDAKLDNMGSGGGRAVNVTVHNYSGEPTKVETDANGDIRLIVGQELAKQLPQHVNNPNSEFNKSLKNNYQLQRRL